RTDGPLRGQQPPAGLLLGEFERARLSFDPDRLVQNLRFGDCRRVQRRLPPGRLQGELGVVDDAAVAAVATEVVIGAHEDAVHRAGIDTQRAEHALRVVDREGVDAEALADRALLLLDVDAVDRTGGSALFAADARR